MHQSNMGSIILLLLGSVVLCLGQTLMSPPSMTSLFKRAYYIGEGGNVKFSKTCKAEGSNITYTWKVNGIEIQNHRFREIYPNGTLFITYNNKTYNQFGDYQCFATNSKGTAMSTIFTLDRAYIGSFPIGKTDRGAVEEYSYLVLPCNNPPECEPKSECRTEWKIGAGTDNSVFASQQIAFGDDGSMHFLYVTRNDQLSSGSDYGCGVWNQILSTLTKGSLTSFRVNAKDDKPIHPVVSQRTIPKKGLIGNSARLKCIFSGYPSPTISWKTEFGKDITSDGTKYELDDYNRVLVVKSLTKEDEMNYRCMAVQDSALNVNKANASVYLNVTAPPQAFPNQMVNLVAPIGTDANFSCKTFSLKGEMDPVKPFWYFNGKEISPAEIGFNQRYDIKEDGTVLVVQKIGNSNTGSFQCMTYNSEGMFMRDATLVVIDPIVVQISPPTTMEILPEEVHYLGVAATTDPRFTLRYSWSFINTDGDHFYNNDIGPDYGSTFPPELVLSANRKNLTIDGSNLEGANIYHLVGTYILHVYHDHDQATFVTEVRTDESIIPVPVVTTSAGGFNPIIIAIILGVIVLFIVIFLIVFLLYRNRGGTYPLDKKELAAGHDPEKELADSGFHDLSRADGFDDEKPTNDRMSLNDSEKDYDSDDNFDQEYGDGDFDTTKFNEDGSFIGQYADSKRRAPNQSVV